MKASILCRQPGASPNRPRPVNCTTPYIIVHIRHTKLLQRNASHPSASITTSRTPPLILRQTQKALRRVAGELMIGNTQTCYKEVIHPLSLPSTYFKKS